MEVMEVNQNYQTLVDNIALDKYGYLEIQGSEVRDPATLLEINAYESNDSHEVIACYWIHEEQRESLKEVAARHDLEYEELPDIETKTKVQIEFEGWIMRIKEKEMDQISHYDKAIEFAKELSYGVVKGYWRNEIAKPYDILALKKESRRPYVEFNVGRARLANYMIYRIGHGTRGGQSYITKRGSYRYHGDEEAGDIDLMISSMVGIGMLKRVDGSSIYELTAEAFTLLKEPKWHERHAEFLSWLTVGATILSIVLMLRELGVI